MTDVTVMALEEMSSSYDGFLVPARAELGLSAFGMQVYRYPPHASFVAPHDHGGTAGPDDGQEEVYVVLAGRARLLAGGDSHDLRPGVLARVGPGVVRQIVTNDDPATVLVVGATPGVAYTPPAVTEVGVGEGAIDRHRRRADDPG
jgi:hypothetical protein